VGVIRYASVFELIGCDDRVVTFIEQFRSVDGLVSSLVAVAFFRQDGLWDTKSNPSIDASPLETSFGFAVPGIGMEGGDFVSEETGCAGSCVGDEGFLLRERDGDPVPRAGMWLSAV
jgi:hypothetical protein